MLQRNNEELIGHDIEEVWHLLWRIKAPPKTLNVVWRALSGCLPTKVQLQTKQVSVLSLCPVCNMEEESIMPNLVSYSFARQCWSLVLPGITWHDNLNFVEWLKSWLKVEDARKSAEIISLCWAIWRSRNDLV